MTMTRAYRAAHREQIQASAIRLRLRTTPEESAVLAAASRGRCWICDDPETAVRREKVIALAVDHDHATGAIRGLLCRRCNTQVGNLEHGRRAFACDVVLFARAVEYLEAAASRART
jgi:hypothetical protein